MSTVHGKDGAVYIGANQVGELVGFKLETVTETADASTCGNAWKKRKAGLKDWTGSIDVLFDKDDTTGQEAMIEGAEVALKLYPEGNSSGNREYSGQAFITKDGVELSLSDMVKRSFDFEGNDTLTSGTVA